MTVWCHLPTISNRRIVLRFVVLILLCVAITTTLIFQRVEAAADINRTLGFQGRLFDASGNVAPDGNYNIQFKLYQDGSGTAAGNPGGTLKWTETYITNSTPNGGVKVRNGFFSVQLGSQTPFGSSVDWNQDTLWLSMNVGGMASTCTTFGSGSCLADGEMLPMKRMTSTPYAMNAGRLNGKEASDFIANSDTQQTANFNISGTGRANIIQGNDSVIAPIFDRADAGILAIGNTNASTINIGTTNIDRTINIGTGMANQIVTLGSTGSASATTVQAGTGGVLIETGASITLRSGGQGRDMLVLNPSGNSDLNLNSGQSFRIKDRDDTVLFSVDEPTKAITVAYGASLNVDGSATFDQGITINGTTTYTTPGGYGLNTKINIPNEDVGAFSTLFAFGITQNSAASARGMLIADARTVAHQPTIGILNPGESDIFGLSWDGRNDTAALKTLSGNIEIQPGGASVAQFKPNEVYLYGASSVTFDSHRAFLVEDSTGFDVLRTDTETLTVNMHNASVSSNLRVNTSSATNKIAVNEYGAGTHDDAQIYVNTNGAGNKGMIIQGAAGQAADLFMAKNSGGGTVFSVDGSGSVMSAGSITSGNGQFVTASVTSASSGNAIYRSGGASGAGNKSGDVTLRSGTATSGADSGNVTIDAGYGATRGAINIGTGDASGVTVGRSGTTVKIGDDADANAPALLRLDSGNANPSTPLYGSMYYSTTLGKVQCYEQDGWGACGAAPDTFVSLSPEYAGSVTNNSGTGVLSTGLCSDALNVFDGSSGQPTICGTNETYNFYKWTTGQATAQTRSMYVTYQLPSTFKNFVAGSTSLMGRTDSLNSVVTYQIYKNSPGGLTDCGSVVAVSFGAQSAWVKGLANGSSDPSTCGFQAGDSILIKIEMSALSNANAYISNLNFAFSSN